MQSNQYPAIIIELLDDWVGYSDHALRIVRALATSRPWNGSLKSRKAKFRRCNRRLAVACGIREPSLVFGPLDGGSSGASHYIPQDHRIVIVGKLSVVTFLHEFAHALGYDERKACRWSINLFRRCFPRQYSRLIHVGHTLIRPQDISASLAKESVR